MKIIGAFGVVIVASIALLQPAEGRPRGGGRSFSSAPHFSRSAGSFSSRSHYSRSAPRYSTSTSRYSSRAAYYNRTYARSGSSPRFSSQAKYRNRAAYQSRQLAVNRTNALNPRTEARVDSRHAGNRRTALRQQDFGSNRRVAGAQTRNWNRNRDYNWHGNRCRWRNNCWVIIGPWYPWWAYGYGYYPYASYSYYDDGYYNDGYYDDRYAASEDAQSEYADSSVSQVQAALAREGYYHGAIDGSIGPATRNALRRYQRNHGLDATGQIDRPVLEALGLG
jgi:hypothetical protein